MPRIAPTQSELLSMVEHVSFDIKQLGAQRRNIRLGVAKTAAENAALYAFLLHARNLLGFYWPPVEQDQRDGDIYAFDYVPQFVAPEADLNQTIPEIKKAISTRVAHICLLRTVKVGWSFATIFETLWRAGDAFLAEVQDPYRAAFRASGVTHTTWWL